MDFLGGGFEVVFADSIAFRFEPALWLELEDLELDSDASLSSLNISFVLEFNLDRFVFDFFSAPLDVLFEP